MSNKKEIPAVLEAFLTGLKEMHADCGETCKHEESEEKDEKMKELDQLQDDLEKRIYETFDKKLDIENMYYLAQVIGHIISHQSRKLLLLKLIESIVFDNL